MTRLDSGRRSATIVKHSLSIAGHRTSISLEALFWDTLRALAERRGTSLSALVGEVDAGRGPANLSSALRVFVLAAHVSQPTSPIHDELCDAAGNQDRT